MVGHLVAHSNIIVDRNLEKLRKILCSNTLLILDQSKKALFNPVKKKHTYG